MLSALLLTGPPAAAAFTATSTTLAITSGGSAVTTVATGSVVTLTATVTAGATTVKVGQVDFCDAAAAHCTDIHLLGTAQLTSAGAAVLSFVPGIGSHSYKAVFVGIIGDAASASSVSALTVTGKYATSTTIAQSGTVGNYTLLATVTGSGGMVPAGNVSFVDTSDGDTVLGMAALGMGTPRLYWLTAQTPATGQLPFSVAVGDFNRDGIPDLAVVNGNDNTLTVLLGKGDGTFTTQTASPATGSAPTSVVVADFNGDGILDLAVSYLGNGPGGVTILLGKGDGTFTAAASLVTAYSPYSLAVGDFNGDGKADLAVANFEDNTVTVQLGNGDGTFAAASERPATGGDPDYIAVGDFNGDGKADLAVANLFDNTLTILLGNGDGTFTATAASPTTGVQPTSVVVADFNGDGKADLAVSNFNNGSDMELSTLTILLGNGDGTFTASAVLLTGYAPQSTALGDFNGDGIPDLAVADVGSDVVTVLLGNGDGTFNPATSPPTGSLPYSLTAGDFNGDGIPDLAVANQLDSTATVLLTQLTQTATGTVSGISPTGSGPHAVEATYPGDSDDGASVSGTILVPPTSTSTTLTITSGGSAVTTVATGSVVTLTATVTAGATTVKVGQVDFCDAAAAHCTDIHLLGTAQLTSAGAAVLSFVPGIGSHSYKAVFVGVTSDTASASSVSALTVTGKYATFTTIAQSGTVGNYTLMATVESAADLASPTGTVSFLDTSNGNSVLGTAMLGEGVAVLLWINSQTSPTGGQPQSVAVGDFNGDGIPDIAVGNYETDSLTVLLGHGDGTFTAAASPGAGNFPSSMAVGDFNGDGIPDLAVTDGCDNRNCGGSSVSVLLGRGDGTFVAAASLVTGVSPSSIVEGDFNGDGIADLAVANRASNTVTMLLGKGDGTFAATAVSPATGAEPIALVAGDFNGDGIPDLAVANYGSNTVTVLLGNGDGTFTAAASPTTGGPFYSIVTVDFNGDGKADLAGVNSSDNTVTVLLGNGDGTFTATASSAVLNSGGSIAAGDFNGDGIPDIAVPYSGGNMVTVLLGKGDGTFTATAGAVAGDGPYAIAAGDFNGDGFADLAVVNIYVDSLSVLLAQTEMVTATSSGISPTSPGIHEVEASYSGDTHYAASTSGTTGLTGNGLGFTIAGTSVAITPGATSGNTSTITVTPSGGFIGSVALSATVTSTPNGAQELPTVSFGSTTPVSITGTTAGTATLTVSTTAVTTGALAYPLRPRYRWYAASGVALSCLLLVGIPIRHPRMRTMLSRLILFAMLSGSMLSCGGGSSGGAGSTRNPGTTTGNYTLTVTGVSGNTTATGTVALTVQ